MNLSIRRQRRCRRDVESYDIFFKRQYCLYWIIVNILCFLLIPWLLSFTRFDNDNLKSFVRFFFFLNILYHASVLFRYKGKPWIFSTITSPPGINESKSSSRSPKPVRKWSYVNFIDHKKLKEQENTTQNAKSLINTSNSSENAYWSFESTDEDSKISWGYEFEVGVLFSPTRLIIKRCSCDVPDWKCRLCPFRAYPFSYFKSWFWYPAEYAAEQCMECGQSCFITLEECRKLEVTKYPPHLCDCNCKYCTLAKKRPLAPRINLLPNKKGHCSCICQKCRIVEELIQGLEPHDKIESPNEYLGTTEGWADITEEEKCFQCWSPPQTCYKRSPAAVLKNLVHRFSPPGENVNSFTGGRSLHMINELLRNFGVNPLNYVTWTSNIRQWISGTILKRIVDEMNRIDDDLISQGLTLVSVGHVGYDTLRATAYSEQIRQNVPTLLLLLPFLELSSNQHYIVQRIRELAVGNTMKEFAGQSGGKFNDIPWDAHLPSDSELIMHQVVTYFDAKLPPLINAPLKRPFSTQYFSKSPKMPPQTKLAIYQQGITPPHYQLIVDDEIHQIPAGSNNVFLTLLLFIHRIKMNHDGMLGRINLGPAGLNMLWIVEDTTRI